MLVARGDRLTIHLLSGRCATLRAQDGLQNGDSLVHGQPIELLSQQHLLLLRREALLLLLSLGCLHGLVLGSLLRRENPPLPLEDLVHLVNLLEDVLRRTVHLVVAGDAARLSAAELSGAAARLELARAAGIGAVRVEVERILRSHQ